MFVWSTLSRIIDEKWLHYIYLTNTEGGSWLEYSGPVTQWGGYFYDGPCGFVTDLFYDTKICFDTSRFSSLYLL